MVEVGQDVCYLSQVFWGYGLTARETVPLTQYLGMPLTLREASGISAKAGRAVKQTGSLAMNNS